jgi:hypothetical protein
MLFLAVVVVVVVVVVVPTMTTLVEHAASPRPSFAGGIPRVPAKLHFFIVSYRQNTCGPPAPFASPPLC